MGRKSNSTISCLVFLFLSVFSFRSSRSLSWVRPSESAFDQPAYEYSEPLAEYVLLDTDWRGTFGWDMNTPSETEPGNKYISYVNFSSEITTEMVNVTNPDDFNSTLFESGLGIWIYTHTVLFEDSEKPEELHAVFSYSTTFMLYKHIRIRYYMTENTTMRVYNSSGAGGCPVNITSTGQGQKWEEILINLDDNLEMDLEKQPVINSNSFRIEFHTLERNVDFVLLDKVLGYTDNFTGRPTTTIPPFETPKTTPKLSTVDDSASRPTVTEWPGIEDPNTTLSAGPASFQWSTVFLVCWTVVLFFFS